MGLQWRQPTISHRALRNPPIMATPFDLSTPSWFAVQVWTGREHRCAAGLEHRGYEVFLPTYCEQRRWSDRVKHTVRALFAGYLFCRVHADVVANVVTVPEVIRLVGSGQGPLPVPTQEIESIRRIVERRLPTEPYPFVEGQRVCVERGPLRGTEGVVLTVGGRRRLVVSISLLQRSVTVNIEPDWVTAPQMARLA
jgi:transcription antitermination factor NusG